MGTVVMMPLVDSFGCVWPNLKSPQSGLRAMLAQPPFSDSAIAIVRIDTPPYFLTNASWRSAHPTNTIGVNAIGSSRRIGCELYLTCHSLTNVSLYMALAGDQTLIRLSPLRSAWAASSEPIGMRWTVMRRPASVFANSWTAHSSHRCFSVP